MKRSRDEQESDVGGEKKAKVNEDDLFEVRVLITNYEAGVVIGKQGANVKNIRTKSGSYVSILKSEIESKERVMAVKGSVENVAQAIFLITELLLDDKKQKLEKEGDTPVDDVVIRFLFHKAHTGAIIGKNGTIIKEIQTQANAKIQLSNDVLPGSTEKSVTISGTPSAIHQAAHRVIKQVAENPLKYSVENRPYVPGRPASYPPPYYPPPYGYPYPPPYGYSGSSSKGDRDRDYDRSRDRGDRDRERGDRGDRDRERGGGGGGGDREPAPGETSQRIAIPTVTAGAVIGKGGTIIADIKSQSGCSIKIAAPESATPSERIVTVTGTPTGIQTAITLIRQRVEQPTAPYTGGSAASAAAYAPPPQAYPASYGASYPAYAAAAGYGPAPTGYGPPPTYPGY